MLSKKVERFKSGVYKITNLLNNKIYVGSSVNVYNRKHTHSTLLNQQKHHNYHLQNSYNKYGEDNFIFEVIEYCNKEDVTEMEQYYIDLLKPEYNKRIEAQNNIRVSPSKECREKISKTLKEKYKNGLKAYNQKHKWKIVQQYDLEGEFIKEYENPKSAEVELSMRGGEVCKAVSIKSLFRKGFQWKYKDSDKIIKKIDKSKLGIARKIIVNVINKNKTFIFDNVEEFCKKYNLPKTSVFRCLKENKIYRSNYEIKYLENEV